MGRHCPRWPLTCEDETRSARISQRPLEKVWRVLRICAYPSAIGCLSGYAIGVYGHFQEVPLSFTTEEREQIRYAFGHLAGAVAFPKAEHARDSQELADTLFTSLHLSDREIDCLVEAAIETAMWAQLDLNGARARLGEFR